MWHDFTRISAQRQVIATIGSLEVDIETITTISINPTKLKLTLRKREKSE